MTKAATKAETKTIKPTKSHNRVVAFKPTKAKQQKKADLEKSIIIHSETIHKSGKEALQAWVDMGNDLIEYQAFYISTGLGTATSRATDKNPLGSFKAYWQASDFGYLTINNVSDAMYIARNFSIAINEMKKEALDDLNGLSSDYIKKKIKAVLDAKNPNKTPEAKKKAADLKAAKSKTKAAKSKSNSKDDLAKLMDDPKAFGELIGKLMVAKYTEQQVDECFEAICVVVDNQALKK